MKLWQDHERIIWRHFFTEAHAYETLQDHPDLSVFVPHYLGACDPFDFDLPARPAEHFVADCALHLELIPGYDAEVDSVNSLLRRDVQAVLRSRNARVRSTLLMHPALYRDRAVPWFSLNGLGAGKR